MTKIKKTMKLTPEIVTPYLPHSLKVIMEGKVCNVAWMSTKHIAVIRPNGVGDYKKIKWEHAHLNIKLILKTMSYIESDDFKMDDWRKSAILFLDKTADLPFNSRKEHVGGIMYADINKLFRDKVDVFGLIKEGLAVNENDIKQRSKPMNIKINNLKSNT